MFLAYAAGEDVDKPTPITREEYFLCYLGDSSASIPDPITRTEKFIAKVYNDAVETPKPTTRLEYILAYITDGSRDTFDAFTPTTREEHFLLNAAEYIKQHSHITFTLSYYNDDGSVLLYSESVAEGGNGEYKGETPTKASTEQYDYSFVGWSSETGATEPTTDVLKNITADKSVYAAFEAVEKTYDVKFYNADVLLYTDENVEYGGTAAYSGNTPTKAETAQYTYTFIGWNSNSSASTADDNALTNVTADRNVYAIYTAAEKTFTVTFYNGEELIYTIQNVSYNGTATYGGDTPAKASTAQYTYTFSGWTKTQGGTTVDADALTSVTANRSVYAVFTQNERSYTVSYYSQDGQTLIDTESVVYGHNASFSGTTPTKASTAQYTYTFAGWNTSTGQTTATANVLDNITADKSVYAAFSETARTYTVYFYNESTLLQTVTDVPYGGSATYTEATPTKTNYTFTGWNPEPTNISGDTSCYAQFEQIPDYITDSWETIDNRGKAGTAQNYYSVGDCKPIELNGTMGTLELDHETVYVYILGFNHNSEYEPNGITFGGFKTAATNGKDICLIDSHYGSSATSGTKYFNMSHSGNYNYGGWKGSDMRYDILGSTDVQPSGYDSTPTTSKVGYDASSTCATNPVANTLMSCLPSDLRAVMKPVKKYTDNKGNKSNTSTNVTLSIDYLPLLSEYEVQGTRPCANQYERNKQAQYAYYIAGNSKIKYNHSSASSAVVWWTRSPGYSSSYSFCTVEMGGGANTKNASASYGVAPCFLV